MIEKLTGKDNEPRPFATDYLIANGANMNIDVTVHIHSEDERRIQRQLREIIMLLEGLVDSAGDKEKMVQLATEIRSKREELQQAIPKAVDGS